MRVGNVERSSRYGFTYERVGDISAVSFLGLDFFQQVGAESRLFGVSWH